MKRGKGGREEGRRKRLVKMKGRKRSKWVVS